VVWRDPAKGKRSRDERTKGTQVRMHVGKHVRMGEMNLVMGLTENASVLGVGEAVGRGWGRWGERQMRICIFVTGLR